MNSEASDPLRPPEPGGTDGIARSVRMVRAIGISLVALMGVGFTVWALTQYFSSRSDVAPLSEVGMSGEKGGASGSGAEMAPSPGMLNVHVVVRLMGKDGNDMTIGSSLPTHVSLELVGEDGRPYEARFDRVGVWLMEVPPGEFRVPPEQKDLGEWKWTLSGANVTKAEKGYTVKFEAGSVPPRLELLLY